MQNVLCDGMALAALQALKDEIGMRSAMVFVLRLLIFVPCLLAVLWCQCNKDFEQKAAARVCN